MQSNNGTWTIGEAKNNSEGPNLDHTQQNDKGHYVFVTAKDHQLSVKTAMFISPEQSLENICIEFWYHMDGANKKKLSLMANVGSQDLGKYFKPIKIFSNKNII